MKKTRSAILIISSIVGAFVGPIGYFTAMQFWGGAASFDKALVRTADAINKTCPIMVDKDTRLDSTMGGPGKKFRYYYTLVNYGPGELNAAKVTTALRPRIVNNAKTSKDMKDFREQNVELIYIYKTNDGSEFARIVVKPEEY